MNKLRISLALFSIVWANNAYASDANGSAAIYGIGGLKCQAVIQDPSFGANTANRQALLSWFLGYLSASNVDKAGTFDLSPILSSDDLYALLYNKCRSSLGAGVQQAASSIINILSIAKSFQLTPLVEFKNEYGTIPLREEVVVQVQNALTKIGLFKGYNDGKLTPALLVAIKLFQTDRKLHQTGLPDTDTIVQLLISPALDSAKNNKR